MREVVIPPIDWKDVQGTAAVIPVKVSWPELQLTHDQVLQNALAMLDGQLPPHEDNSIFSVRIEYPR